MFLVSPGWAICPNVGKNFPFCARWCRFTKQHARAGKRPGFVFQVAATKGSASPIRRLRRAQRMAATVLLSNMWESHSVTTVLLPQSRKTGFGAIFPSSQ
jgi:hypothetical protein